MTQWSRRRFSDGLVAFIAGFAVFLATNAFAHAEGQERPVSICVDRCGDGECQEIVCMGTGCPCAETAESCPSDCRS